VQDLEPVCVILCDVELKVDFAFLGVDDAELLVGVGE